MTATSILLNLSKLLGGRNYIVPDLQKPEIAVSGTEWAREVGIGVNADRINNIINRIKNSPSGPSRYTLLRQLWLGSLINPSEPFTVQGNLGEPVIEIRLILPRPASTWIFLVRDLAGKSIRQTQEISEFRRDHLEGIWSPQNPIFH